MPTSDDRWNAIARDYAAKRHDLQCRTASCDGRCSFWAVPARHEVGHITLDLVDDIRALKPRAARLEAKRRLHDSVCYGPCQSPDHIDRFRPWARALVDVAGLL